ncbi:hypothetical protein HYDPIDRAFT_109155 [Hydnomerulius pinastri MD-312]|nr:hypothetical protein HYDPIDRAFT_109155 [Hydnomerulius pinastri MD-312]
MPCPKNLTATDVYYGINELCTRVILKMTRWPAKHQRTIWSGDTGSGTVSGAFAAIQRDQPIFWNFVALCAALKRKRRLVEGVCVHLISTLSYVAAPRSPRARLISTLRGLFSFAESFPYDIFAISARS